MSWIGWISVRTLVPRHKESDNVGNKLKSSFRRPNQKIGWMEARWLTDWDHSAREATSCEKFSSQAPPVQGESCLLKLFSPLPNRSRPPPMENSGSHVAAGAGAGIATSLIVCPLDVVKIRIQGQLPNAGSVNWRSMGVAGSLRHIIRSEGIRGWYRGLGTTMFTYIPAMSVYFPTYSWAKSYWVRPLSSWINADVYHPVVHIAAALTAGGMTNIVTQPLWLVRTRQMSSNVSQRTTMAVRQIVREEGFLALYKGLGPSMFGLFHVIIQFPLYERLKLLQRTHKEDPSTPFQIFTASIVSKVFASVATYPHEVLRTRLQLQKGGLKSAKYTGINHAVRTIWREEGLRGFYGGLQINVLRAIPAAAITFVSYEMILQWLQKPNV